MKDKKRRDEVYMSFIKHVRLGKDPELRVGENGSKSCFINAAYDVYVEKENKTTWINLVLFDKQAEFISKYGKKGYAFKVSGEVYMRQYEYNGEDREQLTMLVDAVRFPEIRMSNNNNSGNNSNNSDNNTSSSSNSNETNDTSTGNEDDLFKEFFDESENAS